MPLTEHSPVVVVGAGPAGLAASLELARHDVPVLVVERRKAPSPHPRATVLSLRAVELLRAWGLEPAVRRHAADVDTRMLVADTLAGAAAGELLEVGYPTREQSRVHSPVEVLCVAQDALERLLLAHLRRQGSVQVRTGWEVTAASVRGDGALVSLRSTVTGATRRVHARHVVAADGARSTVRRALGIAMRGEEDVLSGVTTLLRAPLWDVVGAHRHLVYSVTGGTFLPTGPSDRWLFGAPPGERPVEELVRRAAGVPGLPVWVEGSRAFSSGAQLAESFRHGPVLLAGDAAHRVTPRGGTGLNLALQDGFDLGWKLAWVHRAWAGDDLLDTYERERRPVAEHTVARSADPQGSARATLGELQADLGGRVAHAWSGGRSTLDLVGTGLTLLAGEEALPAPRAGRVPVTVRSLEPLALRAIGGPVLVRPDGRPAGAPAAAAPRERPALLAA